MKPLFIFGAPRSGTTFFTTAINQHPNVCVTNELRAWTFINQSYNRLQSPTEVLPGHTLRDAYRGGMIDALIDHLRDFYETKVDKADLDCPVPSSPNSDAEIRVWGDKNPGYADANNKNCLDNMSSLMPDAKFIHIHRDPRSCIASYLNVAVYPDDIEKAINIWKRHVATAQEFVDRIGPTRAMSIRYEQLVTEEGLGVASDVIDFLDLPASTSLQDFLNLERADPTPYRSPITPKQRLGKNGFACHLSPEQISIIDKNCEALMVSLGYEPFKG